MKISEYYTKKIYALRYSTTGKPYAEETTLEELAREFAEETTSPRGVEPVINYVEDESEEGTTYNVMKWEHGGRRRTIAEYNDEAQAYEHVLDCWLSDLDESAHPVYYADTLRTLYGYYAESAGIKVESARKAFYRFRKAGEAYAFRVCRMYEKEFYKYVKIAEAYNNMPRKLQQYKYIGANFRTEYDGIHFECLHTAQFVEDVEKFFKK